MRTIVFGKVQHPGKSYAYHLGYTAGMMGYMRDHNPYKRPDQAQQSADFRHGYDQACKDADAAMAKWLEENPREQ